MKVKIPKQIKIAARTYNVISDKHFIRDTGDRGRCTYHTQEIKFDGEMVGDTRNVTFLHEIVHIIDEHYCGREGIDEKVTCGLSEGIYQFLKEDLGIEFDWSNFR